MRAVYSLFRIVFFVSSVYGLFFLQRFLDHGFSEFLGAGGSETSVVFWLYLLGLITILFMKPLLVGGWLWAFGVWLGAPKISWSLVHDVFREHLRSLGYALQGLLFFILPGPWRLFKIQPLVMACFLSPPYQQGQKAALELSQEIFAKFRLRWIVLSLVFEMSLLYEPAWLSEYGILAWQTVLSLLGFFFIFKLTKSSLPSA